MKGQTSPVLHQKSKLICYESRLENPIEKISCQLLVKIEYVDQRLAISSIRVQLPHTSTPLQSSDANLCWALPIIICAFWGFWNLTLQQSFSTVFAIIVMKTYRFNVKSYKLIFSVKCTFMLYHLVSIRFYSPRES